MSEEQLQLTPTEENQISTPAKQAEKAKKTTKDTKIETDGTERFDVRINKELKDTLKKLGKQEGKTQPELMEMLYFAYEELRTLKGKDTEQVKRASEFAALDKALNQVRLAFSTQIDSYRFEANDARMDLANNSAEYEKEIVCLNTKLAEQEELHKKAIADLREEYAKALKEKEDDYAKADLETLEKIGKLEKELDDTKKELDMKDSFFKQEKQLCTSQANELEALKTTLTSKEEQLTALSEKTATIEEMEKTLSSLKTTNEKLSEEVSKFNSEKERLTQLLSTANDQIAFYSTQIAEMRNDYSTRMSTVESSYKEQIENLKEQCAFYKGQNK